MDYLDDLFDEDAPKPARRIGRFKPKARAPPVKTGPVSAHSPPSSQTIQLDNDAGKYGSTVVPKDGQPSAKDVAKCVGPVESSTKHMEGTMILPEKNICSEKSVGEIANILPGLESVGFSTDSANAPDSSIPSPEAPNIPDVDNSEHSAAQDTFISCGEPAVATCEGLSQIDCIDRGTEKMETYPCLETSDELEQTALSGKRTGKFRPKPKLQVVAKDCNTGVPNSNAKDSESTDYVGKERLPTCDNNDVNDVSPSGFGDAAPIESAAEIPANEEMPNADFPSGSPSINEDEPIDEEFQVEDESRKKRAQKQSKKQAESADFPSGSPKINEDEHVDEEIQVENESRKKKAGKQSKKQVENADFPSGSPRINEDDHVDEEFQVENESRKKRARKRSKKQVENADFPSGSPSINEDEPIDEEFQVENESQKKRARKQSKKKTDNEEDEENPSVKRKKSKDKTEKVTKEKPKKFAHTTRQKRRTLFQWTRFYCFEKNTPATTSQIPQVNPRVEEEDTFSFREDDDAEAFGEQATEVEDSTIYFNNQTYMERTPRVRWSKEDTELFYEAIRQVGSNFSMIQQLFPGRTRTQIRLKYKKEEQRHPSRILDALTTRANDHSHLEQIIKRLKEMAAEENQNGDDFDASVDLAGEEEREKEEPEVENNEENEVPDTVPDVVTDDQTCVDDEEEVEEEDTEEEYTCIF
ncbi:unnamed protein product [Cuscuta campestris]|uniref:Uncharacterized protein n=1 Tax=Cuscuta campestris TaxID=132261 RepID=A0A484KN27_9ASTE|nr:unnamed protein product [Cuscuta campestris]